MDQCCYLPYLSNRGIQLLSPPRRKKRSTKAILRSQIKTHNVQGPDKHNSSNLSIVQMLSSSGPRFFNRGQKLISDEKAFLLQRANKIHYASPFRLVSPRHADCIQSRGVEDSLEV